MAKLIVNPTSSARREIPLPRSLLSIGRDPSNDLVLPDAMVSRRHAVIEYRGSQFFIRDCNSSNGSLVNGDKVSERSLRDGDLVAIGTARLLFRDEIDSQEAGAKVLHHPSAPRLQCAACSADYRKGDLFCRQCGAAIVQNVPPRAVCTSCGTAVPLPAKFCNACGSALPRDKQQAESNDPVPASPPKGEGAEVLKTEGTPIPHESPLAEPMPIPSAVVLPSIVEPLGSSPDLSRDEARANVSAAAVELARPQAQVVVESQRPPSPPVRPVLAPSPRSSPKGRVPTRKRWESAAAPAGFGRRLVAGLVDGAIVGVAQSLLLAPVFFYWWSREAPVSSSDVRFTPILVSLTLIPLGGILAAVYYVYFWGARGATPGKHLMGLVVVGSEGEFPIGIGRAGTRFFGYLLSGALLGVGFLMIAFSGLGLHDRIAGTRVVREGK